MHEKLAAEEKALLATPADKLDKDLAAKQMELKKRIAVADEEVKKALTADEKNRDEKLAADLDSIHKQQRKPGFALVATDRVESAAATHILKQGDYRAG